MSGRRELTWASVTLFVGDAHVEIDPPRPGGHGGDAELAELIVRNAEDGAMAVRLIGTLDHLEGLAVHLACAVDDARRRLSAGP